MPYEHGQIHYKYIVCAICSCGYFGFVASSSRCAVGDILTRGTLPQVNRSGGGSSYAGTRYGHVMREGSKAGCWESEEERRARIRLAECIRQKGFIGCATTP